MTSTGSTPDSYAEIAGADRPVTQGYRFPPALPCGPSAEDCTDEDLCKIATDALTNRSDLWALLGSSGHVLRICQLLVDRMGGGVLGTACARELFAARTALAAERDAHQVTVLQLEVTRDMLLAEIAERNRLARLHDRISQENIYLRYRELGTTAAAIHSALLRAARTGLALLLNDRWRQAPLTDVRVDDSDAETEVVEVPLPMAGGAL